MVGGQPPIVRAFGAPTFEEEKCRILAKAYQGKAAQARVAWIEANRQRGWKANRDDALEELEDVDEELQQVLETEGSPELFADKEAMLVLLSVSGELLRRCSEDLRGDPEVVLAAVQGGPFEALRAASEELRSDRDFVLRAIRKDGTAILGATEGFRGDRELVLAAVSSDPGVLPELSENFRGDREIVLAAVKRQNELARGDESVLDHVSKELRADPEIILEGVKTDSDILLLASPALVKDKDFLLQAARLAPWKCRDYCYFQANETVRKAVTKRDFQGARDSALAVRGEAAPVLSVTLPAETFCPSSSSSNNTNNNTHSESQCEVRLLSGTTFSCPLSWKSTDQRLMGEAVGTGNLDQQQQRQPQQQQSKRRKLGKSSSSNKSNSNNINNNENNNNSNSDNKNNNNNSSSSGGGLLLNAGELAARVLSELPKHLEADPPPKRAFLTIALGEGEAVPVTPWDWSKPLSELLSSTTTTTTA